MSEEALQKSASRILLRISTGLVLYNLSDCVGCRALHGEASRLNFVGRSEEYQYRIMLDEQR